MILGLNKNYKLIIIGAGHLGQAVVSFTRYLKSGFNIIAIFEVNPRLIGLRVNGIEVLDIKKLDKFLKENPIDIGIITTNRETAQPVADQLISGGVKGIWNFTTRDLITPTNMPVENLHLTDSLTSLAYHVNEKEKHYENK
jgi:redox-sensing transcriptional repressor